MKMIGLLVFLMLGTRGHPSKYQSTFLSVKIFSRSILLHIT